MSKRIIAAVLLIGIAGWLAAEVITNEEFYQAMRQELHRYQWRESDMDALEGEFETMGWKGLKEADPEFLAFSLELTRREMRRVEEAFQEHNMEVEQTMHQLQACLAREISETSLELLNMGVDQRLAIRAAVEGTRRAAEDMVNSLKRILDGVDDQPFADGEGFPEEDSGRIRVSEDGTTITIDGQNQWRFGEAVAAHIRERIGECLADGCESIMEQVRTRLRDSIHQAPENLGDGSSHGTGSNKDDLGGQDNGNGSGDGNGEGQGSGSGN